MVRAGFSSNQAGASVDACVEGMGFGQFLAYQVEDFVRSGELRVVLPEFEVPAVPVSIVYPDARLMSSRLRALVDWLKGELGRRRGLE